MLNYRNGHLHWRNQSLLDLSRDLGTPFFLICEERLRENFEALTKGLAQAGSSSIIRYCAKTNNEAAILSFLAGRDCHVMVSHPAEAQLAIQCGFSPDRVAYQNPVLNAADVRQMLELGIRFFHAFRMDDLKILDGVAGEADVDVKVSLRLPADSLRWRLSPLGFLSRRLGMTSREILAAAGFIANSKTLELVGLNFYRRTQEASAARFKPMLKLAAKLVAKISADWGIAIEEINCGGGIPSPSLRRKRWFGVLREKSDSLSSVAGPKELKVFAEQLAQLFKHAVKEAGLKVSPRLVIEPGRSMVGNAVLLVSRVCFIHGRWVFLDSSHNFLPESSLLFHRAIFPVHEPVSPLWRSYHLSGNTLNAMDVIDFRRRLPKLKTGDVLVLTDAGAYSISRASRYAGLTPAVYLLDQDGQVRLVRRAEKVADLTCSMLVHSSEQEAVCDKGK